MKVFKLKSNKVGTFKDWANKLNTDLHEEALLSLKEENCSRELFKLFEIRGEYYVVGHMEGENILPSNKKREINKKHREIFKECIEKEVKTEDLYDLKL